MRSADVRAELGKFVLPTRGGWAKPLVLYQNYWLNPERLEHIIPVKKHFKPRRDDIILATYPKCGTTWLKALSFAITTRSGHAPAAGGHPLLTGRDPQKPKDAFVSWWHFVNNMHKGSSPIKFDDALSMFCEGFSPFGPFWEHCLEYWRQRLARPEQILFLKYEEIVSEPVEAVKMLAGFFAVPFTEEEEMRVVPEEVVRLCSFQMLSGLEHNQTGDVARGDSIVVGKSMFFRKGKVGDWENQMSKEMGKKLDDVIVRQAQGVWSCILIHLFG
ncbi:Cytosolic sulfotransferase 5 [Dichanthelium oligosanthes]|uniref:Sulfotransferase n=1 Tax=Dichanthelium oligosanthes TaxID=888268 RepID=A0A1E5V0B8_9POAL|nr:Cytosolic sulfotransferase 5 [Dichanthelium oligosanthes]